MAKTLLIATAELKTYSNISGSMDSDKFIQYIAIAQDIHIQRILGTDLLEKLQSDVGASSLAGAYLTLVQDWVTPALIHWALVEALPMMTVTVDNGGAFRFAPENAQPLQKEEVDALVKQEEAFATYYEKRLIDYLCNNTSSFSEYTSNTDEDVDPRTSSNFCNWVL
jgi:hypothetical protein